MQKLVNARFPVTLVAGSGRVWPPTCYTAGCDLTLPCNAKLPGVFHDNDVVVNNYRFGIRYKLQCRKNSCGGSCGAHGQSNPSPGQYWHMSSKKETTRTGKPTAKSVKHHCHTHTEFFWEQFGNVAGWRTLGELTVVVKKNTAICDVFALPMLERLLLRKVSPCERSAGAGFRSPPSFTLRTKCSCWLSFPPPSFTLRTKCSCWLSYPPLVSPCERSARAGFRSPP